MKPRLLLTLGMVVAAVGAGCGGDTTTVATNVPKRPPGTSTAPAAGNLEGSGAVPDETHMRLDVAERDLERRGLLYTVIGGGASGLGAKRALTVCETNPTPRTHLESGTTIRLIVRRSCPPATR